MSQFIESPSVILTVNEEKIFQLLRDTVTFENRATVLRVAGGWVRDKVSAYDMQQMKYNLVSHTACV